MSSSAITLDEIVSGIGGLNQILLLSFEEGAGATTTDSVNGLTGTITNPVWVAGQSGKALSFDGGESWGCILKVRSTMCGYGILPGSTRIFVLMLVAFGQVRVVIDYTKRK